jgi:hypothetical protein
VPLLPAHCTASLTAPADQDCIDYLSIFSNASGWVLAKRTQLPTRDCSGCAWSPDGSMIAVWDCVLECRLVVQLPRLAASAAGHSSVLKFDALLQCDCAEP